MIFACLYYAHYQVVQLYSPILLVINSMGCNMQPVAHPQYAYCFMNGGIADAWPHYANACHVTICTPHDAGPVSVKSLVKLFTETKS